MTPEDKLNMTSRKLMLGAVLTAAAALSQVLPLSAAVSGVWVAGGSEKVFRFQENHPCRGGSTIWDGKTIHLTGLYNEVLGFQVIVEADSLGAPAVEVLVTPPVSAAGGKTIGLDQPADFGPGGSFEVLAEHYIQVQQQTEQKKKSNWLGAPGEDRLPPRMEGWIPDALIPRGARPGQGGQPLDIPRASRQVIREHEETVVPTPLVQNQGFWIDLYLPRDKSWPAGLYRGTIKVLSGGKTVASLPLEVNLLPHYLPDENHSNAWVFNSDISEYFPGTSPSELTRKLKFQAHRHRIDMVGGAEPNKRAYSEKMLEAYRPWLDGSAFTPENGYQGPGEGQGEKLFPIGMYGEDVLGREDQTSVQRQSDLWVEWFRQHAPAVEYFYYIIDEPGPSQFYWIDRIAGWIHNNPGPGKKLPVFLTREYTPEIKDAIDIWAGAVRTGKLDSLHAAGKQYWFYNGDRPHWGHTMLECECADLRVNAWIKYLYGISTWFVWESTHWTHNASGPKGHLHQRVFSNPVTYINWWWDYGNGDGVLLYPGRMPFYPDEDCGLDEILTSIRYKNIRRGQQDFELMWMAEQKVGRAKVMEVVRSIVPQAFDTVPDKAHVPWTENGEDYEKARLRLIGLLGK